MIFLVCWINSISRLGPDLGILACLSLVSSLVVPRLCVRLHVALGDHPELAEHEPPGSLAVISLSLPCIIQVQRFLSPANAGHLVTNELISVIAVTSQGRPGQRGTVSLECMSSVQACIPSASIRELPPTKLRATRACGCRHRIGPLAGNCGGDRRFKPFKRFSLVGVRACAAGRLPGS